MNQETETIYNIKTIRVKLKIMEKSEVLNNPNAVVDIARKLLDDLDEDQEHFLLLCLDTRNQVRAYKFIASGAQYQVSLDAKIIFRNALLLGGNAIIVCHNHTSGMTSPSPEDQDLTKKLIAGAKLLDIRFLDHIIITKDSHYSFQEAGFVWEK